MTLEFPWNATSETADNKFHSLINELEREMKTRIGFVFGKENRSKSGDPVPWHFYLCLAALKEIPSKSLERIWHELVGRANSFTADWIKTPDYTGPKNSDLIMVEAYNPERRGVEYIVKMVGKDA